MPTQNKIVEIDWAVLKMAIILLFICLLVAVGMVGGSYFYYYQMVQWEQTQRQSLQQVQVQHARLADMLEIVNTNYLDQFNQLVFQGFVQQQRDLTVEEQRLNVEEQVVNLLTLLKLPDLENIKYEILEQTPYKTPHLMLEPEIKAYETQIILRLGLLHEGDMFKLSKGFQFEQPIGLFNLQSCDIKQLRPVNIHLLDVRRPYFDATCKLLWYTSEIKQES